LITGGYSFYSGRDEIAAAQRLRLAINVIWM